MLLAFLLLLQPAQAFEAQREPPSPEPKKQYRLTLRTPEHPCSDWRTVTPLLPKDDILVGSSKRDEDKTCKFLWIISPAEPPGPVKFELEPFGKGEKETFELAAPSGYKGPQPQAAPSPAVNIPGVANENGTGLANTSTKSRLGLPGIGVDNVAPAPVK